MKAYIYLRVDLTVVINASRILDDAITGNTLVILEGSTVAVIPKGILVTLIKD